jgi:hypothetical protein
VLIIGISTQALRDDPPGLRIAVGWWARCPGAGKGSVGIRFSSVYTTRAMFFIVARRSDELKAATWRNERGGKRRGRGGGGGESARSAHDC